METLSIHLIGDLPLLCAFLWSFHFHKCTLTSSPQIHHYCLARPPPATGCFTVTERSISVQTPKPLVNPVLFSMRPRPPTVIICLKARAEDSPHRAVSRSAALHNMSLRQRCSIFLKFLLPPSCTIRWLDRRAISRYYEPKGTFS